MAKWNTLAIMSATITASDAPDFVYFLGFDREGQTRRFLGRDVRGEVTHSILSSIVVDFLLIPQTFIGQLGEAS